MTITFGVTGAPTRFRLLTFGTLRLVGSGDETVLGDSGHQRRRLALLAVLAASGEHGRSRDQLLGFFWPEATQARARHSLDQLLYALRMSLDAGIFTGSNPVCLNAALIDSDIAAFLGAVARGELETAIALYRGPFLDGFYLSDAPEFERWVEAERARLERSYGDALERLAKTLENANDPSAAAPLLQKLIDIDPVSSKHAIGLIRALMNAGDHAAALRYAERYEAIVARELGTSVGPAVSELVAEVRAQMKTESVVVRGVPSPTAIRPDSETSMPMARAAEMPKPNEAGASAAEPLPSRPSVVRRAFLRYGVAAVLVVALVGVAAQLRSRVAGSTPAVTLSSATARSIAVLHRREPTKNVAAAYELYRRGNDRILIRTDSGLRTGIELFRQAIALDSTYAAAWAGLGRLYRLWGGKMTLAADRKRYFALAEDAVQKAITLDDSLAEAHETLGSFRLSSGDLQSGEEQLMRAIALDPGLASAHEMLVSLFIRTGRPADALAQAERGVELDPLAPEAHAELARALMGNDRCDEALAELDKLSRLQIPLQRVAPMAAECYGRERRWSEAIAVLRPRAERGEAPPLALLGFMLARSGQRKQAQDVRATLLARWQRGEVGAFWIAVVSAGLGEREQACEWFERSVTDHSFITGAGDAHAIIIGPLFADVRRQPCFDKLRERLSVRVR